MFDFFCTCSCISYRVFSKMSVIVDWILTAFSLILFILFFTCISYCSIVLRFSVS